jgi:uncharacterized protein (TIGR02246 family)
MRITSLPASVAVFALTLAACQPQPSPTPAATPEAAPSALAETDAAALRALLDRWQQAARAKDWPALAATYTEDGMFMPPNGPAVRGRAAIEAWFKAFPPMSEITVTPEEIDGRADVAYDRGTYSLAFASPAKGQPASDKGKFVVISRKQADGSWLIAIDIFNSDVPLPSSKP